MKTKGSFVVFSKIHINCYAYDLISPICNLGFGNSKQKSSLTFNFNRNKIYTFNITLVCIDISYEVKHTVMCTIYSIGLVFAVFFFRDPDGSMS